MWRVKLQSDPVSNDGVKKVYKVSKVLRFVKLMHLYLLYNFLFYNLITIFGYICVRQVGLLSAMGVDS